MIPVSIPLEAKISVIKSEKATIGAHSKKYLADAGKVYLLAARPLPEGKQPREETLRKLYMLDADPVAIAALIRNLKKIRWTTYWTATEPDTDKFAETLAKVTGVAKS